VGQKSGWERWRALLEAPECRLRESVRSRGTGFLTTCLSVRGVELAAFVRWRSRAVEGEQRPEIARRCDRVNCRARRLVRVGPLTKAAGDARNDALDGLRLLAVAAVLAFHYGVPGGQAGFLGVDVFFVLSGYLITSLMLSQLRHGRVRLGEFWTRRARRLVPALVPVVGATLLWGAVFAPAVLRDRLRGDIASTLFYFANWHFISSNTYFASDGVRSPLEHMWSLAVEEQFYLVWPLLLALVALALRDPRRRLLAIGTLALGGIAVSAWRLESLWGRGVDRAYLGTDSRMFEPLAGALLAVLLTSQRMPRLAARTHWPLLVAGAAAWSWGMTNLGGPAGATAAYAHGGALVVLAGSAAIIAAVSSASSAATAALSLPPVAYPAVGVDAAPEAGSTSPASAGRFRP